MDYVGSRVQLRLVLHEVRLRHCRQLDPMIDRVEREIDIQTGNRHAAVAHNFVANPRRR
jgi:hypothetical protein